MWSYQLAPASSTQAAGDRAWLDVAVDDVLAVQIVNCLEQLHPILHEDSLAHNLQNKPFYPMPRSLPRGPTV